MSPEAFEAGPNVMKSVALDIRDKGVVMRCFLTEYLEPRRHFSAATTTFAGNVLTIAGTHGADRIEFAGGRQAFTVYVNGQARTFDNNKVKTIRIHAGRGDDLILMSPNVRVRASIEAGPGNDRVGGGAGNDTIFGQQGNDTLVANGGNDYFDGGPDDDYLEGAIVSHGGGGTDTARTMIPRFRSGVEHLIVDDLADRVKDQIYRSNGRLILDLTVLGDSSADLVEVRGPELRNDGAYEITSTTTPGGAMAPGYFHYQLDITGTEATGLLLTSVQADINRTVTIPLFLPVR